MGQRKYQIGISSKIDSFSQRVNSIPLKPGYHLTIKVVPNMLKSTKEFSELDLNVRNCKFTHETDGFIFLKNYSKSGCEFECASQEALNICKCLPWFYPNNLTMWPICENFAASCFNNIVSNGSCYKNCSNRCLEDCSSTSYSFFPSYDPIDMDEVCKSGGTMEHFVLRIKQTQSFLKNYEKYGVLKRNDYASNCKKYVKRFIATVSVEAASTSVIASTRNARHSFSEQVATIGGILGLFLGMSLLSFVEIISCLIHLTQNFFKETCSC